jgi:hypothetical protein
MIKNELQRHNVRVGRESHKQALKTTTRRRRPR